MFNRVINFFLTHDGDRNISQTKFCVLCWKFYLYEELFVIIDKKNTCLFLPETMYKIFARIHKN